ncbi:EAL domain-containing protein [Catenulispora pinistramenti]|uniref:sensor domain-containing protein n=1 Tax=Catenulispora pinistramenti TaxID=2705254 RepID=UPI002E781ACB|nr:EAL domain-containing protein [Catenulispora pinistramenti]
MDGRIAGTGADAGADTGAEADAGADADAGAIGQPIEATAAASGTPEPQPAEPAASSATPTPQPAADANVDPDPDPDPDADSDSHSGRPIDEAELDRICLHNLLSACADMIYFKDRDSRFLRVSDSAAAFGGTDPAAMIGKTVRDYFTPEHAAAAFATEKKIMATGQAITDFEEPHLRPGTPAEETLSASKQPLRDFDGRVIGTFGISRDITARKVAERELESRTEELDRVGRELKTLIDTSPDLMARFDRDLRCTYANPAAASVIRSTPTAMLGHTSRERGYSEDFLKVWEESLRHVLATGQNTEREFDVVVAGQSRFLHTRFVPEVGWDGEVTSVLAVCRDLTERRRIEEALEEQAVRDPLTGLANRTLLVSRIRQAIELGAADRDRLAVLFLDLDRFKLVNDSLGHAAGDELLAAVADRLRTAVRRGDLVARFGGDEFVVLCENVAGHAEAAAIAERIIDCLIPPFTCAGQQMHVRTSIGIALAHGSDTTVDELLRDADAAMYQAKADGTVAGGYRFFEPATHQRAVHRMNLEQDLRQAVERGEFTLVYQPIVALEDGRLTGAEALIRWRHPERGLLAPAAFLDMAEETQLIVPIGRWVLDEACRQLAEWNDSLPVGARAVTASAGSAGSGGSAGPAGSARPAGSAGARLPLLATEPDARLPLLAVNLSSRQLSHDADLVCEVTKTIARHGVPPGRICLEVTETAVHEASLTARSALEAFSGSGIKIALDDYGTGYSSLGHLRDNPVDTLKIDRVFISGLGQNRGDDAIVVAVITLAHALGMKVVAEGVETPEQRARLQELGCDFAQGHLFSMPLSAEDFGELLRSGATVGAVPCL